jgi:phage terminase large subunit-like protein
MIHRKNQTNATWFKEAEGFSDRRATCKVVDANSKNIDFKAYWSKNSSKSVISWLVALTPNFEDEDFDLGDNVGERHSE